MRPRPSRQRDLFEVDQKMSDIPNSQKTLLVSLAAHHSPDIPPSELVVAKALRQTLPESLMGPAKSDSLTKFIAERQDMQNMPIFRLAS